MSHTAHQTRAKTDKTTQIARRNIIVLVIAQAVLGAQLPMLTVMAGMAGLSLAPDAAMATVPVAAMGLGAAIASGWLSAFMQRFGRRSGFYIGILGGSTGAAICAFGLVWNAFPIFVLGAFISGTYTAAHGFYRFAAMDAVEPARRAKAMSYVMAGGLVAAVLGTQIGKVAMDALVIPFLGAYVAIIGLNSLGAILFLFLRHAGSNRRKVTSETGRNRLELLADPKISRAILCAATSTGVMGFMMTSTPFALSGFGCGPHTTHDVIMAHVLSMFAPCFVTGTIITRIGAERVVAIGLVLLGAAAMINLAGTDVPNFYAALILLGVGWNFGFLGATAMLSAAHKTAEKGKVQGLNDTIICGVATVAALSSGAVMNGAGGTVGQNWTAVNMGIFPLLAVAGIALIYPTLKSVFSGPVSAPVPA